MTERQILRVFLSSTAIDMGQHRDAIRDAVLRLDDLPVAMESFGARPNTPVAECLEHARSCSVLVVMVAHRYGWVPTEGEGGDGSKSITWLEVEAAIEAGIPVLAYLVDPAHPWSAPKEQDRLAAEDADPVEVQRAVRGLQRFRRFLEGEAGITRDVFTTPNDLAARATAALAKLPREQAERVRAVTASAPQLRVVHPLQPALHFHGRDELVDDLLQWLRTPVHPDRVRSLVGIGGAGKTAVAEQVLRRLREAPLAAHVLVWSFYENPDAGAFLREACELLTGEPDDGPGGRLERLQRALGDERPHLFLLDGLERVQSEGGAGRARGELEDHALRSLLRALAGGAGRSRALVTSRFPITDLEPWKDAGYRAHPLDDLDDQAAIAVLRGYGVSGDDETLDGLARSVGHHALSVSTLGAYLHHFADGDPAGAAELDLDEAGRDLGPAAKLGRVLGGYATRLSEAERDLLVRLSVFPRGVRVDVLLYVVDAGGKVAGGLVGLDQARLLHTATRLCDLGLVFAYDDPRGRTFTAHPFLREYFAELLAVAAEDVHEAVRSALAPSLESTPRGLPRGESALDRYEELIEHSLLAGHAGEAFELFWRGLGRFAHLGKVLGDYTRIERICSLFTKDGDPSKFVESLPERRRMLMTVSWGLAAGELGRSGFADRCLRLAEETSRRVGSALDVSAVLQGRIQQAIREARYVDAHSLAQEARAQSSSSAEGTADRTTLKYSYSQLAATAHVLGDVPGARLYFAEATALESGALHAIRGVNEAEHLRSLGESGAALRRVKENIEMCERNGWAVHTVLCRSLLGLLLLPGEVAAAREQLHAVREWTARSGHAELILRAHHLAVEIARCAGDLEDARREAEIGLQRAKTDGYGKYVLELLIAQARVHLAVPDHRAALRSARRALDLAESPECGAAWIQADALHICGVCHAALGELELARQRLAKAVEVRERIEHPEVEASRRLLADLQ